MVSFWTDTIQYLPHNKAMQVHIGIEKKAIYVKRFPESNLSHLNALLTLIWAGRSPCLLAILAYPDSEFSKNFIFLDLSLSNSATVNTLGQHVCRRRTTRCPTQCKQCVQAAQLLFQKSRDANCLFFLCQCAPALLQCGVGIVQCQSKKIA